MTWKIKGKIGCHFPERTGLNPNFDTTQIFYSDDGVEANVKQIERVYYLPASAAANIDSMSTTDLKKAELERWLVWQRYWEAAPVVRQLAQGSNYYVMQKYEPGVTDVTATKISIFTTRNATDNRCLFILDDNGILVGKSNDESIVSMELHGLTGYKRTMTFSPSFTFKAGKTYWLQYYYDGNSSAPDAYYENEQGLDYKNLSCNGHQSDAVVDLSTYTNKGTTSGNSDWLMIDEMLSGSTNDFYKTSVQSNYPVGLNNQIGEFWYRTNADSGSTYKGIIHHQSDSNKPAAAETDAYSTHEYVMVKDDSTTQGEHFKFYKRNSAVVPSGTLYVEEYLAQESFLPTLLLQHNQANTKFEFTGGPAQYNYGFYGYASHALNNYMYITKNNLNIKYSDMSDAVTAQPANPVENDVYLKTGSNWTVGSEEAWQKILVYYKNGNWHNFSLTNGDLFTEVGSLWDQVSYSDIASYVGKMNPQPTMIDISSQTLNDKRHYLEIDGREVF